MKIIQISAIWCSSCLVMKKVWDQVEKQFSDIPWTHLDLDFDEEATKYQVGEKLPVLILLKNEQEIARLIGEKSKEEVITWLNQNTTS